MVAVFLFKSMNLDGLFKIWNKIVWLWFNKTIKIDKINFGLEIKEEEYHFLSTFVSHKVKLIIGCSSLQLTKVLK